MSKQKISLREIIQYIFLSIITFLSFMFINVSAVFSAAPDEPTITGYRLKVYTNTCKSWKKDKTGSCQVVASAAANAYQYNGIIGDFDYRFNTNSVKSETRMMTTSSGIKCGAGLRVTTYNFDGSPPYWTGSRVQLSGATCDKSSTMATAGGPTALSTVTCTGPVTATITGLADSSSGVPYNSMTLKCSPGQTCSFRATDNVGNAQPNYSGGYLQTNVALYFKVLPDTTKCYTTKGSIYSGTHYNKYYVGTVKCSARCTSDNLAIGGTGYGSTTGRDCYAINTN